MEIVDHTKLLTRKRNPVEELQERSFLREDFFLAGALFSFMFIGSSESVLFSCLCFLTSLLPVIFLVYLCVRWFVGTYNAVLDEAGSGYVP
ncbi:hypothetical protein ACSBR2_021129 [Camellia fascicularis]